MKKTIIINMTLTALLVVAGTVIARAADDLKTEVQSTIAKFQQTDPGLKKLFDNAAGYAVFPAVGKGGLVIGGARGKGLVYEGGRAVGEATLTQASIGAQVGGVSFDQVIFFETQEVLQEFKGGKYSMDAQVSGVIAAEGVEDHAKYHNGVEVFVLPRSGVMAQASVGGQKFSYEPLKDQ
jgi:lipid-binding SYLF domain-containing protein